MYESPIQIMETVPKIVEQMNNEVDGLVLKSVWGVDVDVDKEELIKALRYDRGQYDKGFEDGYQKALEDVKERFENGMKEAIDDAFMKGMGGLNE